jgi:hypothetical protein
MAKKRTSYQIPFDKDGNQLSFPGYTFHEWRDNYEFDATLTYETYGRGRSSVTFYWKDDDGHRYTMFVSDFDDILNSVGLHGKKVTGRWTFVKKGQDYGVKLVTSSTDADS